jgi:hypothetical protein
MSLRFNHRPASLATLALAGLIATSGVSIAQDGPSGYVESPESPELLPAMPMPLITSESVSYEEMSAPGATEIKAQPVARIDYDVTRKARKKFAGSSFVELMMITQNPADGCFYEIPLCLPACCTGEPTFDSRCGLLGRGVVTYCYECGLEVTVKFRLRGDVEVRYGV